MKRINLFIISLLLVNLVAGNPCREVVGYYAGWKWYKRNKLVNPQTIDYSRYTIINYAFFKPLETGSVTEGDSWADKNILLGKAVTINGKTTFDASTSLVTNARLNGVSVIGSIGGWNWSSVFPGIAADPLKRKKFAESCVILIRKYDLDGIDIDWEYPGFISHQGTPGDKANFTLLLTEIRQALTDFGNSTEKKYLLTAAFGPGPDHMKMIEWNRVAELLDIIHVMSYNFYGSWDRITNHNAALFAPMKGNSEYNINSSITRLTEFYQVDPSKITLGIAFYGRSVTMVDEPALHAVSTGEPDAETFPEEKGIPSYYNIVNKLTLFNEHRDPIAMVPYLTGKNGIKSYVSFDDPISIRQKADYALERKLRGVVIWDISGDYLESYSGSGILAGNPLCDAIAESFCSDRTISSLTSISYDLGLTVFPNPFSDEFVLNWNSECLVKEIMILNQSGKRLFRSNMEMENHLKINTTHWSPGIYIVRLITSNDEVSEKIVKL